MNTHNTKFKAGDEVYWSDPSGSCSRYDVVVQVIPPDEDCSYPIYILEGDTEVFEHELEEV